MQVENLTFPEKLHSGAELILRGSRIPVHINRSLVDGVLSLVPPIAETAGVWANGSQLDPLGTVGATILMGATSVIFTTACGRHADTQMQISEWIGPGIAGGLHSIAHVLDSQSTNSQ